MPKLLQVTSTDEFIKFTHEVDRTTENKVTPSSEEPGKTVTRQVTNTEEHTITAHEAPLPAFNKAFAALAAVATKILECPPDWSKGVVVTKLGITYTKTGIRTVILGFTKNLDTTGQLHPLKTPAFQIDDGKTPDEGRKQCTPKHAELVDEAIKQAQRYAAGERSQQMLNWEEEEEAEEKEKKDAQLKLLPQNQDPET